jgi:hypothetical protein
MIAMGVKKKTLVELEREILQHMDASSRAKRIAPRLGEIAKEMSETAAQLANGHRPVAAPAAAELMACSAELVSQASELLRVLEQEQYRQRTAIQMFLYGRADRDFLQNVAHSWNGDQK